MNNTINLVKANKLAVMNELVKKVNEFVKQFLMPIEENWQPSDFLPDSSSPEFYNEIKHLQQAASELSYDYWIVLIGDTITEEALPSYETWIHNIDGIDMVNDPYGWSTWVKGWSAEENRHGDLLNRYLYLSGKVNMHAMETSTQYLIADGFDIRTGNDPYKNFVYTSFQELATNISHRRTASLAKQQGNLLLSKICGQVAADEMRHAKAYKSFVSHIMEIDPSEMIIAFADMMKQKIVMPAHFLAQFDGIKKNVFAEFSHAAQRLGVYTSQDYVDILSSLLVEWKIDAQTGLTDTANAAQDYLLNLPSRLTKIADRMRLPEMEYKFSWVKA